MPGVVFYMGVRHVAKIAAKLSDSGLSPDTPAAVIESATLPGQRSPDRRPERHRRAWRKRRDHAARRCSWSARWSGTARSCCRLSSRLAATEESPHDPRASPREAEARRDRQRHGRRPARRRRARAATRDRFDITVFGDEPYGNYNRILLSNVLNGSQDAKEIFLNPLAWYEENGVTLHAGKRVTRIDREAKTVYAGDVAVALRLPRLRHRLASRSSRRSRGRRCTACSCSARSTTAATSPSTRRAARRAVVIGGGLLGLEAAKGLMTHDVAVTVVEMAPWLMSVQLDEAGGKVLRQTIEKLGITALTGTSTKEILGHTHVDRREVRRRHRDRRRHGRHLRRHPAERRAGEGMRPRRASARSSWTTSCGRATRPCSASASASSTAAWCTASSPRSGSRRRCSRRCSPAPTRPRRTPARRSRRSSR